MPSRRTRRRGTHAGERAEREQAARRQAARRPVGARTATRGRAAEDEEHDPADVERRSASCAGCTPSRSRTRRPCRRDRTAFPIPQGRGAAASARGYPCPVVAHPERIVPDETATGVVALHLKRYDFARRLLRRTRTCSTRAAASATAPRTSRRSRASVVGVDVSADAIAYATERYGGPRTSFREMDVTALDVRGRERSTSCARSRRSSTCASRDAAVREAARVLRPAASTSSRRRTSSGRAPRRRTRSTRRSTRPTTSLRCCARASSSVELYGQRRVETRRHRALAAARRARPAAAVGDPAPRVRRDGHARRRPT